MGLPGCSAKRKVAGQEGRSGTTRAYKPQEGVPASQLPLERVCEDFSAEPELGGGKNIKLALQGGAQLFSYTTGVLNPGHLLESSRELLKMTDNRRQPRTV